MVDGVTCLKSVFCVSCSSHYPERAELDSVSGEGLHWKQPWGSVAALAGVRQCHWCHQILPGYSSSVGNPAINLSASICPMKLWVCPVFSLATKWRAPNKIDLYDVRRRPWWVPSPSHSAGGGKTPFTLTLILLFSPAPRWPSLWRASKRVKFKLSRTAAVYSATLTGGDM